MSLTAFFDSALAFVVAFVTTIGSVISVVAFWVGLASSVVLAIALIRVVRVSFRGATREDGFDIGDEEPQLKSTQDYFAYIWNGVKPFEVRINDRNFQAGDIYYIREYEPTFRRYTGRWVMVEITYVLSLEYFFCTRNLDDLGKSLDGYVVWGFEELDRFDGRHIDSDPEIPDGHGLRLA
jgi:hypothetical protein